jgi:methionyl-tRNA formyltransferase
MSDKPITFTFFGTGEIARLTLEVLLAAGLKPALVVTEQDRARGRGLKIASSPVKTLADSAGIPVMQPTSVSSEVPPVLKLLAPDVAVVVDYGTFLPKLLLDIPRCGFLNMHPSLLPRLRGPSPIRTAILKDERAVGISVMLLDEELDHGPIVAQKTIIVPGWTDPNGLARRGLGEGSPPRGKMLDELLAREGGKLIVQVLPQWVAGTIDAHSQNHDIATYSEKFEKEDGRLDLSSDAYQNLLKIRAFEGWPGTYAYFERAGKKLRVQILSAHLGGGKLVIDSVKPEGKGEMAYTDFVRSGARPL